jgi:hypothetical protein
MNLDAPNVRGVSGIFGGLGINLGNFAFVDDIVTQLGTKLLTTEVNGLLFPQNNPTQFVINTAPAIPQQTQPAQQITSAQDQSLSQTPVTLLTSSPSTAPNWLLPASIIGGALIFALAWRK